MTNERAGISAARGVRTGVRAEDEEPYWTDFSGRKWRTPAIAGRLKFRCRGHFALRAFVYRRDRWTCQICGARAIETPDGSPPQVAGKPYVFLVADHVISRRNGGSNHPDNLQALCDSCNARKSGLIDARHAGGTPGREEAARLFGEEAAR